MSDSPRKVLKIALAGNPNCGKTTIFNQLTGEKRAVGNYSGVTVEMVKGRFQRDDFEFELVDLPGIYSLTAFSRDETVARDFLLTEKPDVIVNVVDASNLERNLFLTLQLKELGEPLLVVFNMVDLARERGLTFDLKKLSDRLELPVAEVVGVTGEGLDNVVAGMIDVQKTGVVDGSEGRFLSYSKPIENEITSVEAAIDVVSAKMERKADAWDRPLGVQWLVTGEFDKGRRPEPEQSYDQVRNLPSVARRRRWLAIKLIEDDAPVVESWDVPEIVNLVTSSVERLSSSDGTPLAAIFAAERYGNVRKICKEVVRNEKKSVVKLSDQADRLLTHPFWGLLIFFVSMYFVFGLTFILGDYPVRWLESGQEALGDWCNQLWANNPDSLLRSLIVDGVIAGVGGVLVFLPNILILFAAIAILEECGYMARGAFLTDRFLTRFGLTGKSFIPMLVGFGCSVPAVMSTRIIEDRNSRLATIFVIPLMSCGARFPIYMLLIPAFFPLQWQAPVLWIVYITGIIIAAILSTVVTKFTFKGETAPLLIELPAYHKPTLKTAGAKAFERGWQYVRKAGTTILGVSILFWAFSTFPTLPEDRVAVYDKQRAAIESEAERLGVDLDMLNEEFTDEKNDVVESSGGAKESEVSSVVEHNSNVDAAKREQALALLERRSENDAALSEARLEYSIAGRLGKALEPIVKYAGFDWRIGTGLVGAMTAKEVFVAQMGIVYKIGEADESSASLREALRNSYPPLVGVCVILFCLISSPCLATVVVVAKESSWKWACAQWLTLTLIGFFLATMVYQLGLLLHLGV